MLLHSHWAWALMDLGGGRSLEAGGFSQEQFREAQTLLYFKDTMKRKYLDIQAQCYSKQRKCATETNAGRSLENTSSGFPGSTHRGSVNDTNPQRTLPPASWVCGIRITFPRKPQAKGDQAASEYLLWEAEPRTPELPCSCRGSIELQPLPGVGRLGPQEAPTWPPAF